MRRARARLRHRQELLHHLDAARIVGREEEGALAGGQSVDVPAQGIDQQASQLDLPDGALRPVALIAVQRDDFDRALGVALRPQQARQRAQRSPVVRHDLQHAPVERHRALGGAKGVLLEDGPVGQQIELERGVRALDAEIEQPAHVVATVGLAKDAVERLHHLLVALVLFHQGAVGRHRLVHAPHLARVHLGQLGAEDAHLVAARAAAVVSVLLLLLLARAGPLAATPRWRRAAR